MRILILQAAQLAPNGQKIKYLRQPCPSLVLIYLAGLTPGEHEVKILDDSVEEVDFLEHFDLVGITALTCQIKRAYQLADEFRRRGVPVAMGGHHASFCPEEALRHADTVFIGEAEDIWPQYLEDLQRGAPQKLYQRNTFHSLKDLPIPRYDLLNKNTFVRDVKPLQATRGCPNNCEFCGIKQFYGGKFRKRPIKDILRDIEAANDRLYCFWDDNLTGDIEYAEALFEAMIPYNIQWMGLCSANVAQSKRLLDLAFLSGCSVLYIGFETVRQQTLDSAGKTFVKASAYGHIIKELKKRNIIVMASMMVGFDTDDQDIFDEIFSFAQKYKLPCIFLYILTPVPGSAFYQRLIEQNRLFNDDLNLYDGSHAVFFPRQMSVTQLENGYWRLYLRFYRPLNVLKRFSWRFPIGSLGLGLLSYGQVKAHKMPLTGLYQNRYFGIPLAVWAKLLEMPSMQKVKKRILGFFRKD